MFALFFSLYCAMFTGTWINWNLPSIKAMLTDPFNSLGTLVTSIFNDGASAFTTFGDDMFFITSSGIPSFVAVVSFILALITSIGIVVMAVKGVKKAFGIFFMGIR